MKIVFMGTPEFAVPCLQMLLQEDYDVAAVFTQPDKPKGRGYKLTPPPVKVVAAEKGVPVYQPSSLKNNLEIRDVLIGMEPDVIVVVAYGKILPKEILEIPRHGCVNVHASLLPKYRGAGPIQWSVINGEKWAGVTTMYMAEGLDTGDMILSCETPIGPDETAGELHDRLSVIGAQCLKETLSLIGRGTAPRQKQDDSLSSYAPMLNKEMAEIDFHKPAGTVHNLIRGLSPWPVAYTKLDGKLLKIYRSRILEDHNGLPGEILDDRRFIVACQNGAIEFLEVQLEGSKRMRTEDFLRGKQIQKGEIL